MSPVIATRTARTWLSPEGILHVHQFPGSEHSLEDAMETVAASARIAGGNRWPMLVDMAGVKSISREARQHYARANNADVITACALVVGSPLSRMIGNFFIGLNKAPVPTRLFTDRDTALLWLQEKHPAPRGAA